MGKGNKSKQSDNSLSGPLVGIIMGSQSDWETMAEAAHTLTQLGVPFETRVVSAHRTPDLLFEYSAHAESRGLHIIIAGAGGAAHLPGMCAAKTELPVIGVPIESRTLKGIDSLLSIVQMPAGVPVATMSIGKSGAINAALLAAAVLARTHPEVQRALQRYRYEQTERISAIGDPRSNARVTFKKGKEGKKGEGLIRREPRGRFGSRGVSKASPSGRGKRS